MATICLRIAFPRWRLRIAGGLIWLLSRVSVPGRQWFVDRALMPWVHRGLRVVEE